MERLICATNTTQNMASIEPGTYRIISKLNGKAITIPAGQPGTIAGCQAPNSPNQKWFVRRSGNNYQFEDCLYGNSIAPDNTKSGTRVNLERHPVYWEILPVGADEYLVKLVGHDLVLDLHANDEIHCWSIMTVPQRLWKFERLSGFAGNTPNNDPVSTISVKDNLIARLNERIEQKDDQLATQNRVIQEQRLKIEQASQQLAQTREELNIVNARLAERNECNRATGSDLSRNPDRNEIVLLREKVDRLESLMSRVVERG
ncbi:hypothetical protein B0J17DRAFT_679685 [Rhizoctonia solani]|nr:hypothetical protein B0J17DRAFT_679685 [Rhizoctonia solani]